MPKINRKKYIKELNKEYFSLVEKNTPEEIKEKPIIDLDKKGEIKLTITKDLVEKWGLEAWLKNYQKEAEHSTGGIRGPQNVLYYWDTRFPLNQIGVTLATLGKTLVLKDQIKNKEINKMVSGEVRYNTRKYIELISRIHAAYGIHTHQPFNNELTAVWMVSFLIFMLDYDGGEYITSSHAISSKIATKDLDNQGSQFVPEMSMKFIAKIKKIIKKAKESPEGYTIKIAPKNTSLITQDFDGIDMYIDYLKNGVATEANLNLIRSAIKNDFKLMYEAVGGCMYKTMTPILKKLGIFEAFEWNNKKEDPFFHGIGKTKRINPKTGQEQFFDLSCDACLFEIVQTMNYENILKTKPVGYVVLITDPDGDRLVIGQVEPASKAQLLDDLGINYIKINAEKIFAVYHPTFCFLMIMDFHMKQMKKAGIWKSHPRFIITTTPSTRSWDEWAKHQGIKILTTPVGFKEIAYMIRKVEKQLFSDPKNDVVIDDVWKKGVNIGADPRLVFTGEESGGMTCGPENIIESKGGRQAIAMREKSAGEASIIATALAAYLFNKKQPMSDYLQEIFKENNIVYKYYYRADITYYNESEPNPVKLLKEKADGEIKRDKIDLFCLGLALSLKESKITIGQAKEILSEAVPDLDFSELEDIVFVGDATYFHFKNMFVEVRKSGTDAKLRGYSNGDNKEKCQKYLDKLVHYSGEITPKYNKLIPKSFRDTIYDKTKKLYEEYLFWGL